MRRIAYNPVERVFDTNPHPANPEIQEVAQEYLRLFGMPPLQPTPYVKNNAEVQKEIARIFQEAPDALGDPVVQSAYAQLVQELKAQLAIIPVQFEPWDEEGEPYEDSLAMMEDVRRGHMFVFAGGADHSLLSRHENWIFRGVHDYFGHAMLGFAFGPRGEENAWMEHSKMFTPLARAALATETRAQNSWVNFGPYAGLPPSERPFAQQKVFLLPPEFRTRPELTAAYAAFPGWIEAFEYAV